MNAALALCLALSAPAAPPTADEVPTHDHRPLPDWLADLNGPDENKQVAALRAIQVMGPRAKAAVPDLVKALKSGKLRLVYEATDALAAIGPDAKAALPDLLAALRAAQKPPTPKAPADAALVARLAGAVGEIDGPSVEVTRALLLGNQIKTGDLLLPGTPYFHDHLSKVAAHLLDLGDDKDREVRLRVAMVLGRLSQPAGDAKGTRPTLLDRAGDAAKGVPAALGRLIADADVHVRIEAAMAAARVAPELCQKAIPVAIESFKTSPKAGHYRAIAILTPCPDEAFPALLAVVEDDPRFRWHAVQTLAGLPVIPQLERHLKEHPKPHVRAAMAAAIGRRYSDGKPAAAALTAALKDPAFEVRFAAAESLVWVDDREGEVAAAGVPVLCEALASDQQQTRLQAGRLLARIGPGARAALPLLTDLLADKNPATRVEAALAMVAIDPKESRPAVPALIEGLGGPEYAAARRTAAALAAIGPPAKAAVPELAKLFDHKDPMTRLNAAEAAARIDPAQADRAVGVIVGVLKDPKNRTSMLREDCTEALRRIGPGAKAAVPLLLEMLTDDGPFHAEVAVTAVALDPVAGKPALEWVRARLAKEDDEDHYDVVNALETVGPNGKALLPELTALLKSKAPYIRIRAAVAVGSVGPGASETLPALRELLANEKSPVNRRKIEAAIRKIEG